MPQEEAEADQKGCGAGFSAVGSHPVWRSLLSNLSPPTIFFVCVIFPPFYLLFFEKLSFVFIMFWLRGIRGINLKGKSLLGRK